MLRHPQHPVSLALQQVAQALTQRRRLAPQVRRPKAAPVSPFAGIRHLLHEAARVYLRPYWKLHSLIGVGRRRAVCCSRRAFPSSSGSSSTRRCCRMTRDKLVLCAGGSGAAVRRSGGQPLRAGGRAGAHLQGAVLGPVHRPLPAGCSGCPCRTSTSVEPAHFAPLFDTELLTFSAMARDLFERGLQALLQLAVIMVTLFVLNWPLALLVLLMLPLVALAAAAQARPRRWTASTGSARWPNASTAWCRTRCRPRRWCAPSAAARRPRDASTRTSRGAAAAAMRCAALADVRRTLTFAAIPAADVQAVDGQRAGRRHAAGHRRRRRPELCRDAEPGHLLGLHPVPARS